MTGFLERWLPPLFFDTQMFSAELWQWLALMAVVLFAAALSWVVAAALAASLHRLQQRTGPTGLRVIEILLGPIRLAVGVAIFSVGERLIGPDPGLAAALAAFESLLLVVAGTWAALRTVAAVALRVESHLREVGQAAALSAVPPGRKAIEVILVGVASIAALDTLGFDTTALLAGLGVGGIAVALAAQKTVENLFGGATVLADRPVRVGDFCRFGDTLGTVEEIGLRSTRIRTLGRTLVSIPNAEFANLQLENYAARDALWYHPRIGLRYETTPEQIRRILVDIRSILYAHPMVDPDPARVRFVGFGAYSLDIDVFAYVTVQDYGEFLEVAEDLNLRIMNVVASAGSGFAFPSRTLYLERGKGIDEDLARKAEAEVEHWRRDGRLYIPRFTPERIAELDDSLEYPPAGSPHATNGE